MNETIIGTGIDIIEVRRIKNAIEKWGEEFLERIFTKEELKSAKDKPSLYQYFAGRFAAKEAVFKALGNKELGWQDVE
ncbi:MAG: holo-ACP synthase, partial [Candidatus Omnitrophica bacterium]|nr:holo-ACP synthase [Candidatus Omnitrophota bacterium]